MSQHPTRIPWYAAAAVVGAATALLFFALPSNADDDQPEGPIVQIGPDDSVDEDALEILDADGNPNGDRDVLTAPTFWIGLQGRTIQSDVLRTHLQLADDLGVVIEQVVPDSPAHAAGLREHDVVIGVNDRPVHHMGNLQEAVVSSEGQPIQMQVIRLAKEIEIEVTPGEMPPELRRRAARSTPLDQPQDDLPNGILRDLLQGGRALGDFDLGEGLQIPALPGGVAITIERQDGQSPKITVKQDGKTWTVDGDDPESLEQLPEQLRGMVERMMRRPAGGEQRRDRIMRRFNFNLGEELDRLLPDDGAGADVLRRFGDDLFNGHDEARDEMLERMEQLERRLEEMQRRLEEERP